MDEDEGIGHEAGGSGAAVYRFVRRNQGEIWIKEPKVELSEALTDIGLEEARTLRWDGKSWT